MNNLNNSNDLNERKKLKEIQQIIEKNQKEYSGIIFCCTSETNHFISTHSLFTELFHQNELSHQFIISDIHQILSELQRIHFISDSKKEIDSQLKYFIENETEHWYCNNHYFIPSKDCSFSFINQFILLYCILNYILYYCKLFKTILYSLSSHFHFSHFFSYFVIYNIFITKMFFNPQFFFDLFLVYKIQRKPNNIFFLFPFF